MKRWILLFGVFFSLLLLNFSSAISASDYEKVLNYEISKYFDEEPLLLTISELRIAVDYYSTVEGFTIDLTKSGLGESAQLIIGSYGFDRGDSSAKNATTGVSINYQAEKRCFDNDIYYYDSTGKKSNKAEECGSVDSVSYRNVCYDAKAEGDCSGDDCYEAECGVCRYDPGMVCMTGKDGYKITPSCVDRPRYLWYDSTGMAGLWGQGGTFGYYNDLNLISVPKFVIGIVYYEVKGRLEWRGESLGGSWYEVCETNNIVS